MEEKRGEVDITADLVQEWLQCPPGVKLRGAKFDPFLGHLQLLFSGVGKTLAPGEMVPLLDLAVKSLDGKVKIEWPE